MADLKLIFVFSCVFALFGLSQVEATEREKREGEATPETTTTDLDAVQRQLTTAFDSLKKSMEELASKFNTEDIVQGVQNLTSKLEGYIKQTADQFASTASGTATKVQTPDQPAPEQAQVAQP